MNSGVATRRRGRGRHTGLLEGPCEGLDPADRAFGTWPARPPRGVSDGRARVYIRGETPASDGDDTVILGGLTLFDDPPPALPRPAPERDTDWGRPPWYRRRWRLAAAAAGLVILAVAAYLGVPPLLTALGIRPQTTCGSCQLPIPSSAAIGPGTGVVPGPSSPAPRPSRPVRTASAPATGPASQAPPPATGTGGGTGGGGSAPPSTLGVSYTAIPTGGGFTGQVTVVNHGQYAVSGWRLVVALPGDSVSAVQNAEFTDDNDVLFLTPAPYDLSIGPGSSVTISIYASGPTQDPAVCSFNGVGCQ
jgi:Cellulose binding domain